MFAGSAYQSVFLVINKNSSGSERPLTVIVLVTSPACSVIEEDSVTSLSVGVYSMVSVVVKPVTPAGTAVAANDISNLLLEDVALSVVADSKLFAVTSIIVFTFCPAAAVIHWLVFARMVGPEVQPSKSVVIDPEPVETAFVLLVFL